jgi:glycosyltransferase involved in cell wall biosynthesis
MLADKKVVILHNIISPYKILLFNALHEAYDNFKVLYISESEQRREWKINKDGIKFSYEIMFRMPLDDVNPVLLFKKTWKHLNALNPEILIIDGYSYTSSWAGLFWAKKNKRKIILWSSSNEDDRKRIFYKEFLKRFFVKRCDAYNVYGTKSKAYLIKLGAKKDRIFIVGNNTDNAFYYNETMKWKKMRDALCQEYAMPAHNFLYIGRFSEEKNIFTLLDAYNKAIDMSDEWGLILVGSGPQKRAIEDYIQKQKIRNVLLPGFQQKSEICKFFAISDVFVLPSVSEPWGLVVNEAMAAGLPVLVSRKCGCYPDIVKDNENGFSFDPFDKNALFNLMLKIVNGETDLEKMGRQSLKIIKDYTPEKAAGIISETVMYVLNEK